MARDFIIPVDQTLISSSFLVRSPFMQIIQPTIIKRQENKYSLIITTKKMNE